MPIPDYQSLMLPVLKLAANAERRVPELDAELAAQFGLTEEEKTRRLPSGKQTILHNRVHWAKFYMTKAGLIAAPTRGRFIATDLGRDLLARDPPRIDVDLLLSYPSFKEFYRGNPVEEGGAAESPIVAAVPTQVATPEEQIEAAHQSLQSALRADLLQRILQNTPAFFEQVIVDLLVAMGYGGTHRSAAEQLGRSGDGGVDGVINEDRLGLDRVYVQAKRYAPATSVGRPDVQAFVGSLVGFGATKGVFVTTSTFSKQAIEYAQRLPQRVILIDGLRLGDLMIEHDVGVRLSRTVQFKRLDEDFFAEEE
ncbi:MAG: restriction endonuclease [Alphaproteobacteria bacterium]|nr:restriction endonuclease [Alphaproteobacteria bacterium]